MNETNDNPWGKNPRQDRGAEANHQRSEEDPTQVLGSPVSDDQASRHGTGGSCAKKESDNTQWSFDSDPAHKPRRTVGLGTALGLMLVGCVAAGTITGVTVSHVVQSSRPGASQTVNSLTEDPISTGNTPNEGVEAIAAKVLPAVVSIGVVTQQGAEEGSGSIISSDGLVLTNNHVVAHADQGKMTVTTHDGTRYDADVIAGDADTDVAVIKLRDAHDLSVISFGNSDELKVGQPVVAVGSPLGLNATVTSGIVSALNRPVRAGGVRAGESSLIDAVQTDAAINPGNSGGPLVDMHGNLVGMNSVIASLSQGQGGEAGSIGLGFAIPSNQAQRLAKQLIETRHVKQPVIGVRVDANARVYGALIVAVDPNGPAGAAGIHQGDVVVKVNDRNIDSADALITAVRSRKFGETISLTVVNPDTQHSRKVEVTLPNE